MNHLCRKWANADCWWDVAEISGSTKSTSQWQKELLSILMHFNSHFCHVVYVNLLPITNIHVFFTVDSISRQIHCQARSSSEIHFMVRNNRKTCLSESETGGFKVHSSHPVTAVATDDVLKVLSRQSGRSFKSRRQIFFRFTSVNRPPVCQSNVSFIMCIIINIFSTSSHFSFAVSRPPCC